MNLLKLTIFVGVSAFWPCGNRNGSGQDSAGTTNQFANKLLVKFRTINLLHVALRPGRKCGSQNVIVFRCIRLVVGNCIWPRADMASSWHGLELMWPRAASRYFLAKHAWSHSFSSSKYTWHTCPDTVFRLQSDCYYANSGVYHCIEWSLNKQ